MGATNKALSRDVFESSIETWTELNLLARHDVYFETRIADRPSLTEAAHALRYQVYCLERRFENADEHSTGLEIDQFDKHAIQGLLFHRPTERAIATRRIILPVHRVEGALPIAQLLAGNNIDQSNFVSVTDAGEV